MQTEIRAIILRGARIIQVVLASDTHTRRKLSPVVNGTHHAHMHKQVEVTRECVHSSGNFFLTVETSSSWVV